jgi:transposase
MSINIIGVDLAKEVFQVHAADENGKKIWSRKLNRAKFRAMWVTLPRCLVVMEACGSSHYWGRTLTKMGFEVKLLAPKFVRPFVKTNKSDVADAEAIVVAALVPEMRFSAIKTEEQQSIMSLHRVRSRLMRQKVQVINQVRGFLREFGFNLPEGVTQFKSKVMLILEDAEVELPGLSRRVVSRMINELRLLEAEIKEYEEMLESIFKQNDVCKRLLEIRGVGFLSASALFAHVSHPHSFKNGRALAAFLGLVPKHTGSGGKTQVLGMSKRGDSYVRSLLIHGARSVVSSSLKRSDPHSLKIRKMKERIGFNKTCVAIANRNARVAWVLMARGEVYRN